MSWKQEFLPFWMKFTKNMLKKATEHRESRTYVAKTMDEFEKIINSPNTRLH